MYIKFEDSKRTWTLCTIKYVLKTVNLKYITVGRLDNDMIVSPSDGPMFILINWE